MLAGWSLERTDWSDCARRYTYVNAAFVCGVQPVLGKGAYLGLRQELVARIEAVVAEGRARDVAIFFRDLQNGPTFGINELSSFAPASLLKLPMVFAYLIGEESNPGFIDRTLTYSGDLTAPAQSIPPAVTVQPGREYKIRTLLANTLIYSDNLSYLILRRYIRSLRDGEVLAQQTFRELGIIPPQGMTDHFVSVHGYASLFRQLYNATYLTPELSELTLSWLARSEFKDGLVAGVPAGTVVAHKFGERMEGPGGGEPLVELHDCGIVYYPQNPYSLCVMTRGTELRELLELVQEISSRVYREVNARRKTSVQEEAETLEQ
jgi:beta-lactamase class A